ncbi:UDP-glycosyltransferase 73C4-like [Cornus florida]|uniref:UDP-glycosyltransferase 73C4-like n=1 Tax=Cornus florida TaxID=4283 RepID=UPI00289A4249|nr:UDP-glycosyltransferase 73C4-like [Cornus florida]
MASQHQQLHFILLPLMAPGHMNPMVDIAKLLAQHGAMVTILTTPLNANRYKTIITRAVQSGLQIHLLEIEFPCVEAGLPQGCENIDMLPSPVMLDNFRAATRMLQQPVEQLLEQLKPHPTCLVSDMVFPWTTDVARKFHIPRLVFHGTCCFSLLCTHNIVTYKVIDNLTSDSDYFVVPGLPTQIELTKAQIPSSASTNSPFRDKMREADEAAYGVIVNSFEELEPEFVKEYQKAKGGKKILCVGPVSLCNKDNLDKVERGNKASVDEQECLKWLDSREPNSVVYASFGSISQLLPSQMIEVGLGLEASNQPFIWVIRNKSDALEKWIREEEFEERTKGRGLLIRGWAPQVLILSHPAIGGFLTHCGWNSTLEGVSAGVPMVTWPLFAEQFCNEKLVVQVLKIGVRVGVEVIVKWGEEESVGVLVKKDDVKKSIDMLMDGGEEGEERRKRARDLGEKANKAIEEGGSSNLNMSLLIQDITEQANYGQ